MTTEPTSREVLIEDILDLAKKFIAIPSTADSNDSLKEIIAFSKNQLSEFTTQEFLSNDKPSLLIHNKKTAIKHFKIIYNAHLDVVPGEKNQFVPVIKNGKLFGRGAYDMKAAAAVMVLVFKHVAHEVTYPFALQLVTDEEIGGHNGTKYQIEEGITSDFVIAGEFTDNEIKNKAKGPLWLTLQVKGVTSHAAYPWLGENALIKMNSLLRKIEKEYPTPTKPSWQTTVNVAKIETTNTAFNRVPDECCAWLDIRVIPEDKENVLRNIKKIVPKDTKIEIIMHERPAYTDQQNSYVVKLQKSIKEISDEESNIIGANGASDIRFYNTLIDVPGVEFGPKGAGAHSDTEWVDINSLYMYYQILKDFLISLK